MKVTYEFDSNDINERRVFDAAPDMHSALLDIYQTIRQYMKHGVGDPDDVIENIRDMVTESGALDIE